MVSSRAIQAGKPPAVELSGVEVGYEAIRAVQGVSLAVESGSVTALVGSNGAGKSSVLRAVAGLLPLGSGVVSVDGVDVSSMPTRRRVLQYGVILVPEGRSVFTTMSVQENLELGTRVGDARVAAGASAGFDLEQAFELFPVLADRRRQSAQVLSGGEQQMLAIARSLLMAPSVLLIDEPSMGLAPLLVRKIFDVMAEVFRRHGVSVLLVEQDTSIALDIADYGYVLEFGQVAAEGTADELRSDDRLRQAYLGSGAIDSGPVDESTENHKTGGRAQ